ncbi:hypothetical protein [Thalassovita sp.]|uniref:hypothetical protein n=1 Tax=Thalassovita sp. TaxID=1979401 RepID=UPI0029DE6288|nr:hypothetical protein [Thalassovita sp.]
MREAPDYTTAALVMGLVNLLWVLVVVWAYSGLPGVLIAGVALNMLINRLDRHRT